MEATERIKLDLCKANALASDGHLARADALVNSLKAYGMSRQDVFANITPANRQSLRKWKRDNETKRIADIEATYHEMEDSFQGWCTECKEWTRDATEPDAEDYDCPACDQNTVIGSLNWLMDQ